MTAIAVKVVKVHPDAKLPAYASAGAAAADLVAVEEVTLYAGCWAAVSTGLQLEIPPFFEGQIRPRSGLALKHGVTVLNAPGTIDSDYRGEVKVILINHSAHKFVIEKGMRIAQLVIAPHVGVAMTPAFELAHTDRGGGGFGSTGR